MSRSVFTNHKRLNAIISSLDRKSAFWPLNRGLGQRHPEIAPTARMLVQAPYVILYETIPDTDQEPVHTIYIVRVVDGRRDLRNLLKS